MNVKRYIAENVTEAMDKVRSDLGRDALILNTRTIKKKGIAGWFKKPLVEVVAAYDRMPSNSSPVVGRDALPPRENALRETPPPIAFPMPVQRETAPREEDYRPVRESAKPARDDGFREISPKETFAKVEDVRFENIENRLSSMSTAINTLVQKIQLSGGTMADNYSSEVQEQFIRLMDSEVREEFAHRIAREVQDILMREEAMAGEVMEQVLRQYVGEPAPIKLRKYKRTVCVMAGPTGVGKTTTLAKLAAIHSIKDGVRVGVITTDTYRIAAVDQLKTYAEILEIPISIAYEPSEVADVLREHEDKDIVFIDTAGKCPGDPTNESELTELIKQSHADEVFLVMSATTSFSGCQNIIEQYSFLKDYKIIFTKADESPEWGAMLNIKMLTKKPVAYVAAGQNVPDDIAPMDPDAIIEHLVSSSPAKVKK